MGILDRTQNVNPIPLPTRVANQLTNETVRTYKTMVDAFNRGAISFWNNPQGATPAEIALALGTDAREVFELHYALGQLIGAVKPEAIAEGFGVIGQFTMNEDGTVTIIESTPEPEPTPQPSGE